MGFRKHEQSLCHKETVEVIVTLPAPVNDVGEMISQQHVMEKEKIVKYSFIYCQALFFSSSRLAFTW